MPDLDPTYGEYPKRDDAEILGSLTHPETGEPLTRGDAIALIDGNVDDLVKFMLDGVAYWKEHRDPRHLYHGAIALANAMVDHTAPALVHLRAHDVQQEQIDTETVDVTVPDVIPAEWLA